MTKLAEIANVLQTTEKNVIARIVGMKLAPVCRRCGGCGSYSFNQIDGSRCYGCDGTGYTKPTAKNYDDILTAARVAVETGKLADYLRFLDAKKIVKNASAQVMAAWSTSRVSDVLKGISHIVNDDELDGLKELRAANRVMCKAWERVSKAASALNAKSDTYQDDVMVLAADVAAAVAEIKAADYEPAAHIIEYSDAGKARNAEYSKRLWGR